MFANPCKNHVLIQYGLMPRDDDDDLGCVSMIAAIASVKYDCNWRTCNVVGFGMKGLSFIKTKTPPVMAAFPRRP